MQIQTHYTFSFSTSHLNNNTSRTRVASSRKPFNVGYSNEVRRLCWYMDSEKFSPSTGKWNSGVCLVNGFFRVNFSSRQMKNGGAIFSAAGERSSSSDMERRKVVEHICLLKAKEDLSEEEEKDMLDYLYTTQYQMGGIIAISLGRISEQDNENYTYAIYMRFQRTEDLAKFYENPFYLGVLKDHVIPYCHGMMNIDYESEVENDIFSIFRKGEEFNYGLEFVLLVAFVESSLQGPAEDALASLANLTMKFPSLIVQATQGSNINPSNMEYTHGVVIRFRSFEALEIFMRCSEYSDIWRSKFMPIIQKVLSIHFYVDPAGTEIM